MAGSVPDLTVRGESVERVYGNYEEERYIVNRRYQRKLIWTLEEKISFIDSIIEGYPVPIILLAENSKLYHNKLEIIDGMQRLDTIVSFIRNRFPARSAYFDLNAIAVSKALLDENILIQREPVLERSICVKIASYLLPLSIYEFADEGAVDTVFRRINSGGRQLSRQELRSAGSVGNFATAVRKISAKVRGDDSSSDVLNLNDMQAISITNKDLDYGIDVDKVFWVYHGVLSRDYIHQSRDEELIADIIAYMVSDAPISSRAELLDDIFGMGADGIDSARYKDIDNAVQKRSVDLLISDFQRTFDELRLILDRAAETFVGLLFKKQPNPVPRYFQVVFLSFYKIIVQDNKVVKDKDALISCLKGMGEKIDVQEGGRWGAENRSWQIKSVIGQIQDCFTETNEVDPAVVHWVTKFENLLTQSYTEQVSYDFKQGFLRLDPDKPEFDEQSFEKILRTCVAVSNLGRGQKGYVLIGVADNDPTAQRIEDIYQMRCRRFERFNIAGVEREAEKLAKTLDQFFNFIVDKFKNSKISDALKGYILTHIKAVRYYELTVYVVEVLGQDSPSLYNDVYYERNGANVKEVRAPEFADFYARYHSRFQG